MGQLGNVDLDFGIQGFDAITKAFTWMDKVGKSIQATVTGIEKPFEDMQKTFESNTEAIKAINDEFKDYRKSLSESKSLMDGLGENKVIDFFDNLNKKILLIGQQAKIMKEVGGVSGLLKMQFAQVGRSLTQAFGPGMFAQLSGFVSVLSSIVPWIIIIGAAVGLIFKIWENNIGNIQGLWIIFTGRIQRAWAQFDLVLRLSLIKLGPLFNAVFKPLFSFVGGFIEGVIIGFTEMLRVMGLVGTLLGPVVKAFEKLFGFKNSGNEFYNQLGLWLGRLAAIGIVILVVVKIVNALIWVLGILKIAIIAIGTIFTTSNPIGWIILGVGLLIGLIILLVKNWDKLKAAFEKLPDPIQALLNPIGYLIKHWDVFSSKVKMVWDYFKNILSGMTSIADFFSKDKKIDVEANVRPVSSGNVNNVNNTTSVAVYSSGQLNPASAERIGSGFASGITRNNMTG